MRRQFMLLVCGFLVMTLILPFQAAATEAGSAVAAESSNLGVTMVAGGKGHSLALKEDGTVWAWGQGGVLGNGTGYASTTPVQVTGLEEVVMVAAGHDHSLALKSDGTVWAWGSSEYGNLGEDPDRYRLTPIQVKGLSSIVAIAASGQHNLALKSDGTVWAWGLNSAGQLGNGTVTDHLTYFPTPAQVRGLDSVTAVAAGPSTSLAIKSDGTLWAWGGNVGDGTTDLHSTPVQVHGLSSVVSIATASHSLAVKSDGTLWAWGGTVGDGTTDLHSTPVQVQSLNSVAAIAADEWHSLALKSDGTVWAWGCPLKGGECYESDIRNSPVQVQNLNSVVAIAAGYEHSLALKSDGTVWAWGWNSYGQLGDGTRTARYTPLQVQGFDPETPKWPVENALTVTEVTYNSVQLNWQPATDDKGVDKYLVYQDNTLLNTLNGEVNSYEVKGLSPKSTYLFSLVAVDADGNQSVKKEVRIYTRAYTAPVSFQLSDSKTYSYGGSNYEYSLYYGYISSSGQVLSGSWSPPEGSHGVVKVSMVSPEGEEYDLSLETVGEGNRLPKDTTLLTNGTEYSAAEVPEGYKAEWRVKGHTGNDFSPDKKVFVYVSIKYDNH
ncbi:fibronectin type III domain-containing protein [Paenibacillus harenae]|uniref:RCC1 domain-containing protein n=1 Tax=Paenibacillus harenae TaxID=306543 RepID=UPI00042359A6|nr:fibronectin type III domain-containing protein [Paenibacillus harenae]